MRKMRDLECRYDTRKSFYGKAKVDFQFDGAKIVLYSYGTRVCEIVGEEGNEEIRIFRFL